MEATTVAEQVQGTCLVVGAAMVFALVALVVKVDPLPLLPATECRFLVSWVVAVTFMLIFGKSRGLHWLGPPNLRWMLLLKSVVSFGFITLWWAALRRAPVGDCITIIYCSPILTSLWSLAILGERLFSEFPFQVVLVIAGNILVLDPPFLRGGSSVALPGAHKPDFTLTWCALLLCSLAPVVTRRTRACSWIEVEHVGAATACFLMDPALMLAKFALFHKLPSLPSTAPAEVALIMLAAGGSFIGIAMETKGYQLAEPGKATMFRYIEVPFAYLLQRLGTSAPVSPGAVAGAVLILASCVLGAVAQHRRAKAAEQTNKEARDPLLATTSADSQGA